MTQEENKAAGTPWPGDNKVKSRHEGGVVRERELLAARRGCDMATRSTPADQLLVIAERDELKARLRRLEAFVCSDKYREAPAEERALLWSQVEAMHNLLMILSRRIANWNTKVT